MEEMEMGFAMGPIDATNQGKGACFPDLSWMLLLLITAMFGGDEMRDAMVDAAMEKAKEVVKRGEQLVRESSPAADTDE